MNSTLTACGLAGALAMAAATGALAQSRAPAARPAAAAAAPAPTIAQGPAIPGICTVSGTDATLRSTVGQYVVSRLRTLSQQVDAELQPQQTSFNNDAKAFQAKRATLDQASLQSQGSALQGRLETLQQTADLRRRELQATERKALNRVAQELDPIVQQLYQSHRCSILISRDAVPIVNPDMDLTAAAITQLNARIQQFPFEREHLDTAPATAR